MQNEGFHRANMDCRDGLENSDLIRGPSELRGADAAHGVRHRSRTTEEYDASVLCLEQISLQHLSIDAPTAMHPMP